MTSKAIYSAIAVVGIAAASGAAYWYQNKPQGPQEITGTAPAASAPSGGASAARAGGGGGPGGPAGVEVAKVEVTTLQDDAQSVGTLRSRQNVMMRPEVAGRIMTLGFSDGARVRKGDVIVQMDDVLQRAEVRQADAQVSIARANLKRNQELVAQSFIAQRVVDESAANMQVVEAQLALACARLDRMRVVAPFDGTVGIRNINIGDYVKDGADLVNIEDLSSMYVDFRLPERFQGKVRRDQQVEMQLDAMPGRVFKARIEAIDPQIDANGRSIAVRAVLPNSGGEPLRAPAPAGAASGAASGARGATFGKPGGNAAARPAQRAVAAATEPNARSAPDAVTLACVPFNASARATAGASSRSAGGAADSVKGAQGGKPGTAPANTQQATRNPGGAGAARSVGAGQGGGQGTGPLRPGMFARVNTVFKINAASLTVPEEAIVPQGGRQFVIKVVSQTEEQAKSLIEVAKQAAVAASAAGNPTPPAPAALTGFENGSRLVSQRTEVKIGIRRPGRVEITEGLTLADTVVIAGQQRLQRDNTPVKIVELGRQGGGQGGAQGSGGPSGQGAVGSAPAASSAAPAAAPASAAR